MKLRLLFFIQIFFVLLVIISSSLSQVIFNPIPQPEGTFGRGISGTQDKNGYMWFAANGLHRYDGYRLTSYFNDPQNPFSLAGNRIETVCSDHNGIIWVGIYGFGLDRFDPSTGIFKHFRHDPESPGSLSEDTVSAIIEDHEGTIWVGTDRGGINRLDQKSGTFTHYRHNPNDLTSLSYDQVGQLYEDRQGVIWVGTGNALDDKMSKEGGGLNRFDRQSGKFIHYEHDPKDPHSLIDNRVRAILEDSKGTFWIGTAGDGLHTMNREKGTFERHLYNPKHPDELSRPAQNKFFSWADDHITFIKEDAAGAVWIGTFMGGLNRYDPTTKKITQYESFNENSKDMHQSGPFWAYTSREGVFWISSWEGGVFRFDPLLKNIPYIATGSPVYSIYEDTSGILWLGTRQGLIRSELGKGIFQHFVHDSINHSGLSNNKVENIFEDHMGILWIGTEDGLNRFDRWTQIFISYKHDLKDEGSVSEGEIRAILEDKQGSLWIGTYGGLDTIDRQTGKFIHYHNNPKDSNSLSSDIINFLKEDRSGNLWIGTYYGGLNRLDKKRRKFQLYLPGACINSILQDSDGIIWVGTSNGLYRSNISLNEFSKVTDAGAGLKATTVIKGILEDNHKNLWLSSSLGILSFNRRRNQITVYGKSHGVNASEYSIQENCYKGKGGELFFGDRTGNGYYEFLPDQLIRNSRPPQVVLSEFRLGDQKVKPGDKTFSGKSLDQTKEIRLKYNQNVFSFDFAGIHYSSPEDNRHLFMLENLDNTWREAGTEKTAYY
ncbi:MAG: two-component regulator propeller domain-containing protein [Ginsengibacter sp.]